MGLFSTPQIHEQFDLWSGEIGRLVDLRYDFDMMS